MRAEVYLHGRCNPYSESAVSDRDTSHVEALVRRGHALLGTGAPLPAARVFRAAIAADDQHVEAHHGLVRALREAGKLERSIAAALALTVLTPRDPRAHAALAQSLRQAGHLREAQTAAARARILEWKSALETPSGTAYPDRDSRP